VEENKQDGLTEEPVEQAESAAAENGAEEQPKKESSGKKKVEKTAKLREEIEALKSELEEMKDRHLRMAAEYENFRRRTREEKESTYGAAVADTVSSFLPLIDNLDRASGFEDGAKVKEGLVMIASSVASVLSKLGVEEFGKPGDSFDPNLHNAVMHEEDDSGRENEITDVFQKGYKKGDRIIRFAMVKTVN
jgi:molecular chaperone GrpE